MTWLDTAGIDSTVPVVAILSSLPIHKCRECQIFQQGR